MAIKGKQIQATTQPPSNTTTNNINTRQQLNSTPCGCSSSRQPSSHQQQSTSRATMADGTASSMIMNVRIQLEENEPLGVRPNDALVITDVQEGTPAFGQLKVGDTIQAVNNRQVQNLRNFYQVLRAAHPIAMISIKRPRTRDEIPPEVRQEVNDNLPAEIATVITRRPGYHYQLVKIERLRGIRFGLAIKTRDNRVIVTEVQINSMCSPFLEPYDHIVYVDGVRVTQAEVAQTLLTKGLKTKGNAELVIGRPVAEEAKRAVIQVLTREDIHDPPSVRLNVDVQQIMRQQIIERGTNINANPQPVYGPSPPHNRRVSFTGQNMIHAIQSDNVGRPLRAVTLGIPNSPIRQQPQQ